MHHAKKRQVLYLRKHGYRIWAIAKHVNQSYFDVAKVLLKHGEQLLNVSHAREER